MGINTLPRRSASNVRAEQQWSSCGVLRQHMILTRVGLSHRKGLHSGRKAARLSYFARGSIVSVSNASRSCREAGMAIEWRQRLKLRASTVLVAFALLLLAQEAVAQVADGRAERFDLFTDCSPIYLVVEPLDSEDRSSGLTEQSIRNVATISLRSAHLYTKKEAHVFLYVRVTTAGNAVTISIGLYKGVFDRYTNEWGLANTWIAGMTGTYGRNAAKVLANTSRLMDEFLAKYLQVNEEACAKR